MNFIPSDTYLLKVNLKYLQQVQEIKLKLF
jgi:hypothetical protein